MTVIFKVRKEKQIVNILKALGVHFKVVPSQNRRYKYIACLYISSTKQLQNKINDYLKENNLGSFEPEEIIEI